MIEGHKYTQDYAIINYMLLHTSEALRIRRDIYNAYARDKPAALPTFPTKGGLDATVPSSEPALLRGSTPFSEKKARRLILAAALFAALAEGNLTSASTTPEYPLAGVREMLNRLVGARATDFRLEWQHSDESGKDVFEVEAHSGIVTVSGDSLIAISRGTYSYLREACHCFQGWEGSNLKLPKTLPDWPKKRVVCPYRIRPYYNVCTLGYTTAFWDWKRWERELDWMALHGINAAIAEVGTEAIWDRVWKEEGVDQAALDRYFPGPAFMPWHRMGNINHWQGPPPRSFFPKQIALEKRIVARMRELGIEPIAPAFAGFVPPELQVLHPDVHLQKLSGWAGFTAEYGTYLLDPVSPLYLEIGRRFIRVWESEFGHNRYFLADSFNELKVPVPADRPGRLAQLARYGDVVYRSILAGEPNATWIMQGWLFYDDAAFWDQDSVAALLSKVPNDRMVILDLACDFRPIWSSQHAFYGKQWVYSVIHNFGGKSSLGGDLKFFAADGARTLADSQHGNLVGYGLSPEGIENNEVAYELITDAMWSENPINLNSWMREYAEARYGGCSKDMAIAWELLARTCYAKDVHNVRPIYQYQPLEAPPKTYKVPDDSPEYLEAVKRFLSGSSFLGDNSLYRADAIELTVQYLGSRVDALIAAALTAHRHGDSAARERYAAGALDLMDDMDGILAFHPINRLDRWIKFARGWGDTPAEADYYEADAKWQITIWGADLSEYSSRVWNGLIRDYYRERWKKEFQHLATGDKYDLIPWEISWINSRFQSRPEPTFRKDLLLECQRLLGKGEEWQHELGDSSSAR